MWGRWDREQHTSEESTFSFFLLSLFNHAMSYTVQGRGSKVVERRFLVEKKKGKNRGESFVRSVVFRRKNPQLGNYNSIPRNFCFDFIVTIRIFICMLFHFIFINLFLFVSTYCDCYISIIIVSILLYYYFISIYIFVCCNLLRFLLSLLYFYYYHISISHNSIIIYYHILY